MVNDLETCDVAVIGAGPFGLSIAAHLKARGVAPRIFGRAMETWARQMPKGMLLKSDGFATPAFTIPAVAFPTPGIAPNRAFPMPRSARDRFGANCFAEASVMQTTRVRTDKILRNCEVVTPICIQFMCCALQRYWLGLLSNYLNFGLTSSIAGGTERY
jgi:flavin-dependent dehydrogenase